MSEGAIACSVGRVGRDFLTWHVNGSHSIHWMSLALLAGHWAEGMPNDHWTSDSVTGNRKRYQSMSSDAITFASMIELTEGHNRRRNIRTVKESPIDLASRCSYKTRCRHIQEGHTLSVCSSKHL